MGVDRNRHPHPLHEGESRQFPDDIGISRDLLPYQFFCFGDTVRQRDTPFGDRTVERACRQVYCMTAGNDEQAFTPAPALIYERIVIVSEDGDRSVQACTYTTDIGINHVLPVVATVIGMVVSGELAVRFVFHVLVSGGS